MDQESVPVSEEVRVGALSRKSFSSRIEDVLSEECFSVVVDLEEGRDSVCSVGQGGDREFNVARSSASSIEEVSSDCDIEVLGSGSQEVLGGRVQLVNEPGLVGDTALQVRSDGLNLGVAQERESGFVDSGLEESDQVSGSLRLIGSDDKSKTSKVGDILEESSSLTSSFSSDGVEVLSLFNVELSDLLGGFNGAEASICVGLVWSANEEWRLVSSAGQQRDSFAFRVLRIDQGLLVGFVGSS